MRRGSFGAGIAMALVLAVACGSSDENATPMMEPDAASDGGTTNDGNVGGCGATESDPDNCGRCGRRCGGAACRAGVCAPTKIAENQERPWSIVVAGGRAYWVNLKATFGTVWSTPVDGSSTPAKLREENFFALATDGTHLWMSAPPGAGLVRCSLPACGDEQTDVSHQYETIVFDNAILGTGAIVEDGSDLRTRALVRAPADATTGEVIFVFGENAYSYYLAARDGFLAWSESGGSIRGCTHAACAPRDFAPADSPGISRPVATDGKRVYFTQGAGSNAIVSCPVEGCSTPETIADSQPLVFNLAVSGAYVYWTVDGGRDIRRCPTSGCGGEEPVTIAIAEGVRSNLSSMTFDDEYVYWTDTFEGVGSVWRAPK